MKPLVSVVIPCFDGEAFVGEAIESVLKQTYRNVELIVVDDGSTDGSLDVIKSYDSEIRWDSGVNEGAAAARNRGLQLARGEFVQFLDADDLLHPSKLEIQVREALRYPYKIVYCDYVTTNMRGELADGLRVPERGGVDAVCFILNNYGLQTSSPLHQRKQVIKAGGFRSDLVCSQERDLHLRLACMGTDFVYLRQQLFTVRKRPGGISSDFVKVLDQHEDLVKHAFASLRQAGLLTEERRVSMAAFLARDARIYMKRGLCNKADRYFEIARSIHKSWGVELAYAPKVQFLARVLTPPVLEKLLAVKRKVQGSYQSG